MLGKKLAVPLEILKIEALLRRILKTHQARSAIESDLVTRKSGFNGEKSLEYYLSFLKENQYVILHDLRLQNGNYYFQIDILLLSLMFNVIVENKNRGGTIVYDPTPKRYTHFNYENKEEALSDPIAQAQRQKYSLEKWLAEHQLPSTPLEYLVNFSHPSVILKSTGPTDIFRKLGTSDQLLPKIYEIEKKYKQEKITWKDLRKISRTLLKNHCPRHFQILEKYSIKLLDILSGVLCPNCFSLPMIRKHGTWKCTSCKCESKDAHIQAIYDYFLLIEPKITVEQCCKFLHLKSRYTAKRLLISMGLQFEGTKKGRVYFPKNDFFH